MPTTDWNRPLEKAIQPQKGKKIVTLLDAYEYILTFPKKKQAEPLIQAAALAILEAAEGRAPMHTAQAAAAIAVNGPRIDEQPKKPRLKIGKRLNAQTGKPS